VLPYRLIEILDGKQFMLWITENTHFHLALLELYRCVLFRGRDIAHTNTNVFKSNRYVSWENESGRNIAQLLYNTD